jgi:hypothetical protein
MDVNDILLSPLAATTLTKGTVDVIRINFPSTAPIVPIACAFLCGPFYALLLVLARGIAYTPQTIAIAIIQGLIASLASVGVNRLGNKAQEGVEQALKNG